MKQEMKKEEMKKEATKPLSETSQAPELKAQELDSVVGGGTIHGSRSNIKNNIVTNTN